ncbi:anhydro-N-acetylmuramic acid kinase [Aquimarina sp. W85]|uniref:anhydro-N-acetylmuramic acid kinase n=1 Tax=Aquimarina rhodophyticola TaxID=3342246 RepID=UPI00366C9511
MAITNDYHVIGLMSGTSLDGLDIAYCRFGINKDVWSYKILKTDSINYSLDFKAQLKNAIYLQSHALIALHNNFGTWMGTQVNSFISKHKLKVDFISSHGHTVLHQPEIGITYQIGSGQHLANSTGQKVICDFRSNDVYHGGQGAPLVPIGDHLLFSQYEYCLNLGGISNISYEYNNKRIAYDIAPVNMLLNHICNSIDLEYDDQGKLAKSGQLNATLLNDLNSLAYYSQAIPKSMGYEWFASKILPILERNPDTPQNLLHTAVHHITHQIAQTLSSNYNKKTTLLVTGGGAKNHFFIEILAQKLGPSFTIVRPHEELIDHKESLIFAFMGVLKERGEINCLSSVTGATKNSSSGVIFKPA